MKVIINELDMNELRKEQDLKSLFLEMLAMLETIENIYTNGDPLPAVELDELIQRAREAYGQK